MDVSSQINKKPKERKSGIELLKIVGILLVVISHVVQTLEYNNVELIGFNDYYINLNAPTSNLSVLILAILRHSGHLGNSIFFLSSAWFLLESKKPNFKKILRMICDVWVVSIIILIPCLIISEGNIQLPFILRSFFPTICFNNWYVTTYIIFCFIYPFFNTIINKINPKIHLLFIGGLFLLFYGLNTIYKLTDFSNVVEPFVNLSIWFFLYFVVAFLKKYAIKFCSNVKLNLIICVTAIIGLISAVILLNYYGLKYPELEIELLKYNSKTSIFLLLIAFSALNVCNSMNFKSSFVNYFSSMSLLIYIIHENLVFKRYYRPAIWQWIYVTFGYEYIIEWAIVFIFGLFAASTLISYLYKVLIQKPIYYLSDKIYEKTISVLNFNK